jgi:hypothetical protein
LVLEPVLAEILIDPKVVVGAVAILAAAETAGEKRRHRGRAGNWN